MSSSIITGALITKEFRTQGERTSCQQAQEEDGLGERAETFPSLTGPNGTNLTGTLHLRLQPPELRQ